MFNILHVYIKSAVGSTIRKRKFKMADAGTEDRSVFSDDYLLHNPTPDSPHSSKVVRYSDDILLQTHGINTSTQKKIGPLGRKRRVSSMLDFTRKFSRTSDRSELTRENRPDESGLAAMHLAAQANQVSRIDELVRRHSGT